MRASHSRRQRRYRYCPSMVVCKANLKSMAQDQASARSLELRRFGETVLDASTLLARPMKGLIRGSHALKQRIAAVYGRGVVYEGGSLELLAPP